MERIINKNEPDYQNFETVAEMLNLYAKAHGMQERFYVEDTYLDYGQDWMWTTICSTRGYQLLYPVDWQEIYLAIDFDELIKAFEAIVERRFKK